MAVSPEFHWLAEGLSTDDFVNEVEYEMPLPAIGVIAGAVQRRRNQVQVLEPILSCQRLQSHEHHSLRHRVGIKLAYRCSGQIVLFGQFCVRRV